MARRSSGKRRRCGTIVSETLPMASCARLSSTGLGFVLSIVLSIVLPCSRCVGYFLRGHQYMRGPAADAARSANRLLDSAHKHWRYGQWFAASVVESRAYHSATAPLVVPRTHDYESLPPATN